MNSSFFERTLFKSLRTFVVPLFDQVSIAVQEQIIVIQVAAEQVIAIIRESLSRIIIALNKRWNNRPRKL